MRGARLRVDRRRDRAHRAADLAAVGSRTTAACRARSGRARPRVTSARHSSRLPRIRRNISCAGWASEPTVAVRAEMVPSSGATTRVWREPVFLRLQLCPRSGKAGGRRLFAGRRLGRRLRTDKALGCEVARARRVRPRLGQDGFRLGDRRPRLGGVGRDGFGIHDRQGLALLHAVADVDQHLGDPVTGQFGTHRRLLPGDDVALRGEGARPVLALGATSATLSAGRGPASLFAGDGGFVDAACVAPCCEITMPQRRHPLRGGREGQAREIAGVAPVERDRSWGAFPCVPSRFSRATPAGKCTCALRSRARAARCCSRPGGRPCAAQRRRASAPAARAGG